MTGNGNSCGSCTLCCKLTSVPEFNKPPGEWCRHCKPGRGCTIYDDRPESCRNFRCVWLTGGLPDDLRPDKCKVIFERLPSGRTFLVLTNNGYTEAWKKREVKDIIASFLRANKAIVVGPKPGIYFIPKGRKREDVMEDLREAAELYGLKVVR